MVQGHLSKFPNSSTRTISPLRSTLFYLEDVSVRYGDIHALKGVQLKVERGEMVFVTGASGAGKSTLLKLLGGQIKPTSGSAITPTNGGDSSLFVASMHQDLRLIENRSCEDNLFTAYDTKLYKNKNEFYQDVLELARILGIKDRLGLRASDANGGLRQKVAFMRTLLSRPDVFLADEPTSSLDADNGRVLFDVLNLYNTKRGLTVVWASHNRELVSKFSGRILHLDNGKLVYSGHACFI
jgi:cell division transport system ATP-binding protein